MNPVKIKIRPEEDMKQLRLKFHGGEPRHGATPNFYPLWVWILPKPVPKSVLWDARCEGPFFLIHERSLRELGLKQAHYVCPHIAEID